MEMRIQFQRCFSCRDCQRPLDPFLCCDTPDMEIVCKVLTFDISQQVLATSIMLCKGCYAKSYSVTSEWCNMSGGDALKLLNTTTIMPGEGETVGEICPRWESQVLVDGDNLPPLQVQWESFPQRKSSNQGESVPQKVKFK